MQIQFTESTDTLAHNFLIFSILTIIQEYILVHLKKKIKKN